MRKLMALAIVFMLAGATTSWALFGLGDISYDGSMEVSGNSANNETDFAPANDHRGRTATRVRLGMNATVTEGVMGRVELIRDTRQYGTGPTSVAGEEGTLRFHNAYVDIADFLGHDVRLGRQYVGNPGDLVWNISPTDDDNLTNNSIDGLLIKCRKYDFLHVDLFTGKATEDDTIGDTGRPGNTDTDDGDVAGAGDVNLSSLDLLMPTLVPNAKVNVGFLWGTDSNNEFRNNDNNLRTARVGINGSAVDNMLTYRAEYFQNMGQFNGAGLQGDGVTATELDYSGNAIDLGVGVNFGETEVGTFSIWGNYLMASGDDNTQDDSDDSFHDFTPLGFNTSDRLLGEIFGKSNVLGGGTPLGRGINTADVTGTAPSGVTQGPGLNVINLGVSYKPAFVEKTMVRLDYYTFSYSEDNITTAANTKTKIGDDIGSEIDLTIGYDHSTNVGLEVGYAMLSPDKALTDPFVAGGNVNDDEITKLFARAKIKWGGQ